MTIQKEFPELLSSSVVCVGVLRIISYFGICRKKPIPVCVYLQSMPAK
uniref:Uncharacterized protein n=1 Tax=Anguilla anguilla TaxID=7936 RepID=A0A0E9U7N7_ANGAN